MKFYSKRCFKTIWLVAIFLFTFVSYSMADKISDWKKLSDLYNDYLPYQSQYSATHLNKAYVDKWQKLRDELEPFAKEFKDKYGKTSEELKKNFISMEMPEGVQLYPHNVMDILNFDFEAHQKKIAGWLKEKGDESYKKWENLKNPQKEKLELKVDYANRAINSYKLANELYPDIAEKELEKSESAYKETKKQWMKVLDKLEWPGNNPDFKGPGKPEVLAAEALKLLNKMKDEGKNWSKPEYDDEHIPFAACVVGSDWEVHKKVPLTGVPTQYTIKMFVLFKGTQSKDIGYGYYMQFYTKEEAGVKKEPPFFYCNSRSYEKHKMLLSKAPSSAKGNSSSVMGNIFGFIIRLILAVTLITGGFAASGHIFATKITKLSRPVEILKEKNSLISIILIVIGILTFIFSILSLSPFSNILPQICAVVLGLSMYTQKKFVPINEKLSKSMEKANEKLELAGKKLAPFTALLGQAAIALGLIHLLIGGVVLF
ncbi:MAG: hypothetical protein H6681_00230 [Desulfobacteraceae bacterium]|nr:hypothetical protein [Desulfobacteraceae bacterium]